MLVFTKINKINSNKSKTWIYITHNNTKYYLIAYYLPAKQINRANQTIKQYLIKCIKVQNRSGTKLIS